MPLAAALALSLALRAVAAPSASFEVETLARTRDVIWGFDFLPDGRIIFTERGGRLVLWDPKTRAISEVEGAPPVRDRGQGGLLDVKLHPGFAKNRWVYLTWSHPVPDGAATAFGRGRLEGAKLAGFERLFLSNAGGNRGEHFGSRIVFDGPHVYVSLGERGRREDAQKPGRHNGKIVRLSHDGKPAGADIPGAAPGVWSLGHRNPQGLALRPGTNELWDAEFGPRGGDELNLVIEGANYGWPVATYGREYHGPRIGKPSEEGMRGPDAHWTPSISPSGLAFYDGAAFPQWRGSAFLACLSGSEIRRVTFKDGKPAGQESLLDDLGWRFRMVRQGPDGLLYFSTDDGRLARLKPAK